MKLRTPIKVAIPEGADRGFCKSAACRAPIFWVVTSAGKRMPVNPDGISHFATCPDAPEFRQRRALEERLAQLRSGEGKP